MEIWQITAIGIIGAVLSLTLRRMNAELAIFVAIATGIIIFFGVAGKLSAVLQMMNGLSDGLAVNSIYISIIMKVVGIAYIAEFGIQLCNDAQEHMIASKIELAGKILIMAVSAPVIVGIMETVSRIIP